MKLRVLVKASSNVTEVLVKASSNETKSVSEG